MAIDLSGGFSIGPQKPKAFPAGLRSRTVRTLFPVIAPEDDPVKFQPEPVEPEAGARWGRPGNFAFTVADADTGIPTGGGVTATPPDKTPVTRYKYLETGASVTRDAYNYKNHQCEVGNVKDKNFETEFFIARTISFEFDEIRPKPHIYNFSPIWKYDYYLQFLHRSARQSEWLDDCGNSFVTPIEKFSMQDNYENDTECATRLQCTCEATHSEDEVQEECFPETDTGDPERCIQHVDSFSGPTPEFHWIICGCFGISGDKEFWPPPLPEGWEDRPCAQYVDGNDSAADYWYCVCCPPWEP